MTFSTQSASAFITAAAKPILSQYHVASLSIRTPYSATISQTATIGHAAAGGRPSATTCLGLFKRAAGAAAVQVLADHSGTAISYFTSIRVPAALITGSSLAALFTLVDETLEKETQDRSKTQSIVLVLYHILALTSLLLSLNVIVTATATANSILLGCANPMATTAFALLIREYEFEFLMTRWSFFTSLFAFMGVVASRALVEFELLRKARLRSALLVLFSVATLFFHLLSFVNSRLVCYNNLAGMTMGVFRMWFQRSTTGRNPSELASLFCFFCSVGMTISVFRRTAQFSRTSAPVSRLPADLGGKPNDSKAVTNIIDESCDGDDAFQ